MKIYIKLQETTPLVLWYKDMLVFDLFVTKIQL
jgi:hypothetical protein